MTQIYSVIIAVRCYSTRILPFYLYCGNTTKPYKLPTSWEEKADQKAKIEEMYKKVNAEFAVSSTHNATN